MTEEAFERAVAGYVAAFEECDEQALDHLTGEGIAFETSSNFETATPSSSSDSRPSLPGP